MSRKRISALSDKKLDELQRLGQDSELTNRVNFQSLINFSRIYIHHARDLARSGQKDEARNWLRFFQNSQLVAILAYQVPGAIPVSELKTLSDDLKLLNGECHPLDQADWTTDIEAIRSQIELLIKISTEKGGFFAGSSGLSQSFQPYMNRLYTICTVADN